MITSAELCRTVALGLRIPAANVGFVARWLEHGGHLPRRRTAPVTASHATNLLLGVMGSWRPAEAARVVGDYREFTLAAVHGHTISGGVRTSELLNAEILEGKLPVDSHMRGTLGDYLDEMIRQWASTPAEFREFMPAVLEVSRSTDNPWFAFHCSAHPNFKGGVLHLSLAYGPPGARPQVFSVGAGLETRSTVPGSILKELASLFEAPAAMEAAALKPTTQEVSR